MARWILVVLRARRRATSSTCYDDEDNARELLDADLYQPKTSADDYWQRTLSFLFMRRQPRVHTILVAFLRCMKSDLLFELMNT